MHKSINSHKYFFLIILSILFQSLSGITGKYAAISIVEIRMSIFIPVFFYIVSLMCLFFQAIVWQQALIHYPLSYASPFMSLINFVILFASALIFNEGITLNNILGLILISIGITVISQNCRVNNQVWLWQLFLFFLHAY